MALLSACEPFLDRADLKPDGAVQRILVSTSAQSEQKGPHCGPDATGGSVAPKGSEPETTGYRVGPGDNLRFNIFGEERMTDITARVDDAGYVQLPIVELVRVAGKTTREIHAELKKAFEAEFRDPWITVELVEAESAPIYFLGEFRQPGVRYMEGSTNLLEAIALAGGLEEDAYLPGARLLRKDRICTVDLQALLRNGDFGQNVWIRPNDVIFAPRREDMVVYVLGAVNTPQAIPFGDSGRTLLQVLSMSGGTQAAQARLSEIRIVRTLSPTRGELIVVDAAAMLSGRGLDFPLEPGDVVFVPASRLADWNAAFSLILPSLQVVGGILTPITLIESLATD